MDYKMYAGNTRNSYFWTLYSICTSTNV